MHFKNVEAERRTHLFDALAYCTITQAAILSNAHKGERQHQTAEVVHGQAANADTARGDNGEGKNGEVRENAQRFKCFSYKLDQR
jgi:hypothetical protein